MRTTIAPTQSMSERGNRRDNQDSICCLVQPGADSGLFVVCDGVGGAASGAVASRLACEGFGHWFGTSVGPMEIAFEDALECVQRAFDRHLLAAPLSRGMGTTLALLRLQAGTAFVAHIGDSRVYQFRDGNVLFRTDDHSLANEMLKSGMIGNLAEAKRSVITRAIQGLSVKFVRADMSWLTDVLPGDYFLVCSDGVWGVLPDGALGDIFRRRISDAEKLATIRAVCEQRSNDNYSLIFFRMEAAAPFAAPAFAAAGSSSARARASAWVVAAVLAVVGLSAMAWWWLAGWP